MRPYGVVYLAVNLVNGKKYIGQTTLTVEERKRSHRSRSPNAHLARAFKKYGFESFVWRDICCASSQEELDGLEDLYICLFETTDRTKGYNCKRGGLGGKMSEDARRRISESKKGSVLTDAHKKKLSEARKGRWAGELNPRFNKGGEISGDRNPMYGKRHSEETRKKISEGRVGKGSQKGDSNGMYGKKPPNTSSVIVLVDGVLLGDFLSIAAAAERLDISQSYAVRLASGTRRSRDGIEIKRTSRLA